MKSTPPSPKFEVLPIVDMGLLEMANEVDVAIAELRAELAALSGIISMPLDSPDVLHDLTNTLERWRESISGLLIDFGTGANTSDSSIVDIKARHHTLLQLGNKAEEDTERLEEARERATLETSKKGNEFDLKKVMEDVREFVDNQMGDLANQVFDVIADRVEEVEEQRRELELETYGEEEEEELDDF